MSWPGEASRPIARPRRQAEPRAVLRCLARAKHRGLLLFHVGRSLATSCFCFLGAPDLRPVSTVCDRRNAAKRSAKSVERISAAEWSGWQSWRVRTGRGRNSADTCPERLRGSVGSVKPGFPGREAPRPKARSEATRFLCLTPRTLNR